jgi:hypothetical protein
MVMTELRIKNFELRIAVAPRCGALFLNSQFLILHSFSGEVDR